MSSSQPNQEGFMIIFSLDVKKFEKLRKMDTCDNILSMYLSTDPQLARCDTRSIYWAEFNRFKYKVFLLLDQLPYQG